MSATEFVIAFRPFRGAGAEIALAVGTSEDSNSAVVAFCFPFLLLDIVEVGGSSGETVDVCWDCDVLEPLINSENLL
jgi:hypothetical protein